MIHFGDVVRVKDPDGGETVLMLVSDQIEADQLTNCVTLRSDRTRKHVAIAIRYYDARGDVEWVERR